MNTKILPLVRWAELLERAEERPKRDAHPGGGSSSLDGDRKWAGATYAGALQMMRYGWAEGTAKVAAVADAGAQVVANEPAWSIEAAGFFPCIPAYLSGEPECMWMRDPAEVVRPRVVLVVPAAYNANVKAEEVLVYAGALAAVVGGIEAAGLDVAVYSVDYRTGKYPIAQGFAIREFGDPLDLSKVAFAFHPAFLRRVLFAWDETTPERVDAGVANFVYGQTRALTDDVAVAAVGELAGVACRMPEIGALSSAKKLRESELPALIETMRAALMAATKA